MSMSWLTSTMSGRFEMVTGSSVSRTADRIWSASFFAPWGMISPFKRCPPSMMKLDMVEVVGAKNAVALTRSPHYPPKLFDSPTGIPGLQRFFFPPFQRSSASLVLRLFFSTSAEDTSSVPSGSSNLPLLIVASSFAMNSSSTLPWCHVR